MKEAKVREILLAEIVSLALEWHRVRLSRGVLAQAVAAVELHDVCAALEQLDAERKKNKKESQ